MTENSIELDAHRGMAAQKATEARRHTVEDVLAVLERRAPVHTLLPP